MQLKYKSTIHKYRNQSYTNLLCKFYRFNQDPVVIHYIVANLSIIKVIISLYKQHHSAIKNMLLSRMYLKHLHVVHTRIHHEPASNFLQIIVKGILQESCFKVIVIHSHWPVSNLQKYRHCMLYQMFVYPHSITFIVDLNMQTC